MSDFIKFTNLLNGMNKHCQSITAFEKNQNGIDVETLNVLSDNRGDRKKIRTFDKKNIVNIKNIMGRTKNTTAHRTCAEENCYTYPNYNHEESNKGLFCSKHKHDGMINVNIKYCCYDGCKRKATHNYFGESPECCSDHCDEGMINVISKKCKYNKCAKSPLYNYKGSPSGIYCIDHKSDGMVYVKKKYCKEIGCEKQPYFNYEGEKKGIFCNSHKQKRMICVHYTKCANDRCETKINPYDNRYGKYCFCCHFLNDTTIEYSGDRAEEIAVSRYINKEFGDYSLVFNNKLRGGISDRRPDILFRLEDRFIDIEIDEYQHIKRHRDDLERNIQIHDDFNNTATLIVRFNPHGYKLNRKKYDSCWHVQGDEKFISAPTDWILRLLKLKDTITEFINRKNPDPLTVVYLYYDE